MSSMVVGRKRPGMIRSLRIQQLEERGASEAHIGQEEVA